jgi:GNAT superfamily N-acetyltransferase
MTAEIVMPETPLPEHRETIFRLLDAFNDERSGFPDPVRPLALLLREPGSEAVLGGLWGVSYWQWLFVDLLFVPEALRGQGMGSELLGRAETIAREACLHRRVAAVIQLPGAGVLPAARLCGVRPHRGLPARP